MSDDEKIPSSAPDGAPWRTGQVATAGAASEGEAGAMIAAPSVRCTKIVLARWEAERDAWTHPSWQPRCDKCEAGLVFRPYRCLHNSSHWHLGHGDPREWEMGGKMAILNMSDTPQIATPPTERVPMVQTVREQQAPLAHSLVSEMADALEVLVDYAGRPLPRFLKVDLDAIRALVDQARAAS